MHPELGHGAPPRRRDVVADDPPSGCNQIVRKRAAHDAEPDDPDRSFLSPPHCNPTPIFAELDAIAPACNARKRLIDRAARRAYQGACRQSAGMLVLNGWSLKPCAPMAMRRERDETGYCRYRQNGSGDRGAAYRSWP